MWHLAVWNHNSLVMFVRVGKVATTKFSLFHAGVDGQRGSDLKGQSMWHLVLDVVRTTL